MGGGGGGREGGRGRDYCLLTSLVVGVYVDREGTGEGVRRGERGEDESESYRMFLISLQPTVRKTLSSAMATLSPTKVQ